MGLAQYRILGRAGAWTVEHDGKSPNDYATKEAAFEAAVAAACTATGSPNHFDRTWKRSWRDGNGCQGRVVKTFRPSRGWQFIRTLALPPFSVRV